MSGRQGRAQDLRIGGALKFCASEGYGNYFFSASPYLTFTGVAPRNIG